MKYMLLIHDDAKAWAKMSEVERGRIYGEYGLSLGGSGVTENGSSVNLSPAHVGYPPR